MQVVLDEMDLQDLRNTALPGAMADVTAVSGPAGGAGAGAGGSGSKGGGGKGKGKAGGVADGDAVAAASSGVRIATIDNYQVTILTARCGT